MTKVNGDMEGESRHDAARENTHAAKTPFEDFLIAEYSNIAHAHFNITDTISNFFRHYLLIVSLPLPLLGVVFKGSTWTEVVVALRPFAPFLWIVSWLVALVGLFVMCYVSNLRFDAILYARTINGVRKFFYDCCSGLPYEAEERVRLLPRSTHRPLYCEYRYFFWVVLAFAFINAAYFAVGSLLYLSLVVQVSGAHSIGWAVASWVVFLSVNLCSYCRLARHRENRYLRSHIIGVDIDGVLNCHRDHFCKWLEKLRNKHVDPDSITRIPVHRCDGLNVSREDEYAVFNHPLYWKEMPEQNAAARRLQELRKIFGYKIILFTHRPWPEESQFRAQEAAQYGSLWDSHVPHWRDKERGLLRSAVRRWLGKTEVGVRGCIKQWIDRKKGGVIRVHIQRWLDKRTGRAIRLLTEAWLEEKGIPWDKLVIELGNVDTWDSLLHVRNRFKISRDEEIRLFVEDDLDKAKRLADICDFVFLIDHPYNRVSPENPERLPNNLQRVYSWDELYEYVRKLF